MQSWRFRHEQSYKNIDSTSGDLIGLEAQDNYIYKCTIYTMPIFISWVQAQPSFCAFVMLQNSLVFYFQLSSY